MTDQAQAQQRTKPLSTPIKIYQTDFSPGKENALQAAVASIFGLDLSKVPNFIEVPEGYEASIRTFVMIIVANRQISEGRFWARGCCQERKRCISDDARSSSGRNVSR
eukprot:scaffold34623_cov143-Skeletonema_menzelii.AAC.1